MGYNALAASAGGESGRPFRRIIPYADYLCKYGQMAPQGCLIWKDVPLVWNTTRRCHISPGNAHSCPATPPFALVTDAEIQLLAGNAGDLPAAIGN